MYWNMKIIWENGAFLYISKVHNDNLTMVINTYHAYVSTEFAIVEIKLTKYYL